MNDRQNLVMLGSALGLGGLLLMLLGGKKWSMQNRLLIAILVVVLMIFVQGFQRPTTLAAQQWGIGSIRRLIWAGMLA